MRVSNSRDRLLRVPAPSSCLFGVWAFAGDEAVALLSECTGASSQLELEPGQPHVETLRWSPPAAGTFTLLARLSLTSQQDLEASTRLLVRQSPESAIPPFKSEAAGRLQGLEAAGGAYSGSQ